MSNVRVEWVTLGTGALYDGTAPNVLRAAVGSATLLTAGATATAAGSRPQAPAADRSLFARVSAVDGPVIAAFGANPTAAANNGVLILEGQIELLPVVPGDLLSFIQPVLA